MGLDIPLSSVGRRLCASQRGAVAGRRGSGRVEGWTFGGHIVVSSSRRNTLMSSASLEDYGWLVSEKARPWLALAAEAPKDVNPSQTRLRRRRHGLENLVASRVTVGVVDRLELVDIEHDATKRLTAALDQRPGFLEPLQREPPIRQARQRVGVRELFQLLVQGRQLAVDLAQQRRKKVQMEMVMENFIIRAPASGMVIYKREFGGEKRTVGSEISTWDLTLKHTKT